MKRLAAFLPWLLSAYLYAQPAPTSATVSGGVLTIQGSSFGASGATRPYYCSFDDSTVTPAPAAWGGNARLKVNLAPASDPAVKDTDYSFADGGITSGGKYALMGQNRDTHWIWEKSPAYSWPTNELYISYWFRFESSSPDQLPGSGYWNFKNYYPNWGSSRDYFAPLFAYTNSFFINWKIDNVAAPVPDGWTESVNYTDTLVPALNDGNWHHFEDWTKFNPASVKWWHDGAYVTDNKFHNNYDLVWTGKIWPQTVSRLTALGEKSGSAGMTFHRALDEIEVWDGLARVVLCAEATWTGCTKKQNQTPTTWGASSITVGYVPGLLTGTKYAYVVNSSGVANANGVEVTEGDPPENDVTNPTIAFATPTAAATYATASSSVATGGTASDNTAVTSVTCSTDTTATCGTVTGTTDWTVTVSSMPPGVTIITITAHDAAGNLGTDTLTVTYTPADSTNPTITITTLSQTTTASSITVSGTASDNVGVSSVTWSSPGTGSGTATGTLNWSQVVSLFIGDNVITMTARDAAGNTASSSITVLRTSPTGAVSRGRLRRSP